MRLIDADSLKEAVKRNDVYGAWNESDVMAVIDNEPTVDAIIKPPHTDGWRATMIETDGVKI